MNSVVGPPSSRHPFEIFILALCVAAGAPIVFGDRPPPSSIDALLPQWALIAWGAMLAGGAAVALIGCFLPNRLIGVLVEQVGLVATGMGTLIYAACGLIYAGISAAVPSGIVLGFGLSCLWRWLQLQRLLRGSDLWQLANWKARGEL